MQTKDEVLEKSGAKCVACGWGGDPSIIHVHHIVAKADGGPDYTDNQITLCPNHHVLLTQLMAGLISVDLIRKLETERVWKIIVYLAQASAIFRLCAEVNRFGDPSLQELLVKVQEGCAKRVEEVRNQISS